MSAVSGSRPWPEVFDDAFNGRAMSVEERVWRHVYGDEYPVGLDPYSYISMSELRQFAAEVQVVEGDTLVDIGCGQGGPGLWVATESNASLIGIDISQVALEAARERAQRIGRANADFRKGSFEATSLDDASVDAVMSVDAFLFAPDKRAAAAEIARILRPGGRLVMTTWDYHRQPEDRPPQLADHRPLLRGAGFNVLSYEDTVLWRERQDAVADGLLANAQECADAAGVAVDEVRARLQAMRAMSATMIRRVLIVGERPQA
jgi:SAM-dependent methyltransferase